MFIHIFVIIFIVISCKYCHDMLQFNQISDIKEIHKANKVHIQNELKLKNPIIVHNLIPTFDTLKDISVESFNKQQPGYIIKDNNKLISLEKFLDRSDMYVHENKDLLQDFNLQKDIHETSSYFTDKLSCNIKHSLSIYKGHHSIFYEKNKHNVTLLSQLYNSTTVYIINPKHNEDIKQKTNQEIKKWASKISIQSGQILSIPPEWFYFYETKDTNILVKTTCDNYFTYLFNTLR